jgi:MGT family glycosyltransferase
MKNAHIAYFGLPHHPHVNPTLPIIAALVRRGYRVTYVTSDLFAPRVVALGAEVLSCPRFLDVVSETTKTGDGKNAFCHLAIRTLAEVTPFYEGNRPDLLLCDFVCLAGRILANRWKIPTIQTSPHFGYSRGYFDQQMADSPFRKAILDASQLADRFLTRHGIDYSDFLFHREKLNMHFFPRVFEPCAEAVDSSRFYAGRCAGEQPYYGDWQRTHHDGRPIALISTSTTYVEGIDHLKLCIEALADLSWHVVISVGYSGDTSHLPPLPPHFEVVQREQYIKILRYASLFVCLGGTISASESAYHGVPMIITSYDFPEQVYFGEIFERLGLAVHLRKADMTADNLRASAIRISEDVGMQERVRELQRMTLREPGGEETANRIEEFLEGYGGSR